ncbi:MAG: glycosyltransferase family 4 protein [Isosphaeraceae bacterium]
MRPLRVVLVMIEPPLPFGNAAARWFYVSLRGLVERGHHVTAFAACGKPAEVEASRDLFPGPQYDFRPYPIEPDRRLSARLRTLSRPFSYMFSERLRTDLAATLAGGFDVLHLEQLWSGWLGLDHIDRTLVNVHYLLGIDLEATPPSGLGDRKDRILGLSAERRLIRRYRHLRACTPRLEESLRLLNPSAEVSTVPFGIDTTLYPFIPAERRQGPPTLTLIGSMNWGPSRSAAERLLTRLWPAIKARVPDVRLTIVGWQARQALAGYLDLPDVTVLENVPETRPYFEATSVFLYAPGRGSGMKIKIQEAMAYGVPVVTTSEGVEGLPAVDGVHAGICEDDDGLIERTVGLLRDFERQETLRRSARTLIESHCGPKPTVDAIESLHAAIARNGRA